MPPRRSQSNTCLLATLGDADLRAHLRELGLASANAYRAWCADHRFGTTLRKSPSERRAEIEAVRRETAATALAAAKRRLRRPDEILSRLYEGVLPPNASSDPVYCRIAAIFDTLSKQKPSHRKPFLRLLQCAQTQHTRFLGDDEPALGALGQQNGNTWVEGLRALAAWHDCWVRAPENWRSPSKNARRQFASLARHLLAQWEVPLFLDHAWFDNRMSVRQYQEWFRHVGNGSNIRTVAGLPITLTKRAAHLLARAPKEYTIEQALRWAQIRALGGDDELVRALLATPLGEGFTNEEFWSTVVQFLAANPLLDRAQVGPIVDYINHRKFMPEQVFGPGFYEAGPPPDPAFSMKGRTPAALLRLVETWHRERARERAAQNKQNKRTPLTWEPSGIGALVYEEGPEHGYAIWTLREILTNKELGAEGRAMQHCIATYAASCAKGHTSVWTLQVQKGEQEPRRVMTIAVHNAQRAITQARGRFNALPNTHNSDVWLDRAPRLLNVWAEREGLTLAPHLWGG